MRFRYQQIFIFRHQADRNYSKRHIQDVPVVEEKATYAHTQSNDRTPPHPSRKQTNLHTRSFSSHIIGEIVINNKNSKLRELVEFKQDSSSSYSSVIEVYHLAFIQQSHSLSSLFLSHSHAVTIMSLIFHRTL